MINIIINLKSNRIISVWSDGSITWLPLDEYEFQENEDYSMTEQNEFDSGYSNPRIVKGSFLKALLKTIKKNVDN